MRDTQSNRLLAESSRQSPGAGRRAKNGAPVAYETQGPRPAVARERADDSAAGAPPQPATSGTEPAPDGLVDWRPAVAPVTRDGSQPWW